MIFSQIPGTYVTVLFNNLEFEAELRQVECDVDMAEYLSWILVELGFPVLTPPWLAKPQLVGLARVVKRFHEREVYRFLTVLLQRAGYNGEELVVTARSSLYSAISFLRS